MNGRIGAAARAALRPYGALPDEKHVDVLDGVRALMVLLVGAFHIWQQSWLTPRFTVMGKLVSLDFLLRSGYIWVDGLILLSGFLLYLPIARLGAEAPFPSTRSFFRRRFWRIYPSYALNVLLFFLLALPRYGGDTVFMAEDLAAHLTFTHTLFYKTYYVSPINGALWTVGVEVQFYLLFPLLGRCYRKHPLATALGMTAVAFAWRGYASTLRDCALWFNQLLAFLDVYALGFVGAEAFVALRRRLGQAGRREKVFFSFTALASLLYALSLARLQAARNGQEAIRIGQMDTRFPFCLALLVLMVSAAFALPFIRFLLGNRVMRFLSAVSFQFYMIHQVIAVRIREWGLIPSVSDTPNMMGERAWQVPYTLVCFLIPLVLAALLTYGFERPLARRFAGRK